MEEGKPGQGAAAHSLGPVLDFMRVLWALDHRLQSTSKRMETTLGVTGPQRLVIRIVGQFPGISAGEAASILHIHPSTLTGVLRRLETRGALSRKADPEDARRALLFLTPHGQTLNRTRGGTVEAAVQRVLAKLPPGKLKDVREALVMLTQEVEREGSSRPPRARGAR